MGETITYHVNAGGYGEIRLNRPEKRNAISLQMAKELKNALNYFRVQEIKFLLITANGEKIFCAGGDLNDLHGQLSKEEAFNRLVPMKEVLWEIVNFPVPVICLLIGDAYGGGCELATACDLRIASRETKFGFIQAKLGIVPGWGGGALLYEKVHPDFAFQWIIEGKVYDAKTLERKGWIHRVAEKSAILDEEQLLKPYMQRSRQQMKLIKKQYIKNLLQKPILASMTEEVKNSASLWDSPEHISAVEKFLARPS